MTIKNLIALNHSTKEKKNVALGITTIIIKVKNPTLSTTIKM
jgi:hypothetical protein